MIVLSKMAVLAYEKGLRKGVYNVSSSTKAMYNFISREWRRGAEAKYYPSELPEFTQKEIAAADVIISAITYLHFIGCKNIDELIRARIDQE